MKKSQNQENNHNTAKQSENDKNRIFMSLMERVGLEGSYQTTLIVLLSMISYLTGGLALMAPYLFYQDPYTCPGLALSGQSCTNYICSQPGFQDCFSSWH